MTNIFENIKIQDIINVILIILVIYLLFRNNSSNENFDVSSELNKFIDPIKNLGAISAQIMDSKGNLTIPANTNMDGNLIVKGDIISEGNNQKIVILTCGIDKKYTGPILDSNGFSIPVTKYWCKPPTYLCDLGTESDSFKLNPPMVYENIQKNEWWVHRGDYQDDSTTYTIYIYDFTPRTYFYSGIILPNRFSIFKEPYLLENSGILYPDWPLFTGFSVLPIFNANDSTAAIASLIYPIQNIKDPNPYYN